MAYNQTDKISDKSQYGCALLKGLNKLASIHLDRGDDKTKLGRWS